MVYRMLIGKERRDQLYTTRRLYYNWSPSYKVVKAFFKILKLLKIPRPEFIKIFVPSYNYKFYVRSDKEDFANFENFQLFRPKQGDNFVDLDAHIGRYTMIAAKKVSPTGKVIAIEPDPENCNLLKQNVGLNRKGYFMGVYALIFLL
jgi:hypothetical protein